MGNHAPIYTGLYEHQKLKDIVGGHGDTIAKIIDRLDELEERVRELEVNQPTDNDLNIEEYEDLERDF